MARITVEDCLENVENRFRLVLAASIRTKELAQGARSLYPCKNKNVVTALREIGAGRLKIKSIEDSNN